MLEKIKKGLVGIASTAATRKRTSLSKLDALVFEELEQSSKTLLEQIAEHEKQVRREQRENEQKSKHIINSERTVKTTTRKQTTARSKATKRKANTAKRA